MLDKASYGLKEKKTGRLFKMRMFHGDTPTSTGGY